jgi:hypothetical protein
MLLFVPRHLTTESPNRGPSCNPMLEFGVFVHMTLQKYLTEFHIESELTYLYQWKCSDILEVTSPEEGDQQTDM